MASIHGIDRYTFDRYFTAFLNSIKMIQINFCVTLFRIGLYERIEREENDRHMA